jgi:hypothetical protein
MSVLDRLGKDDLLALAREADLPGRSAMTKAELADALTERLRASAHQAYPAVEPLPPGRWSTMVDRDGLCDAILPNGVGCDLPPVVGKDHCGLHGGSPIEDVAWPILGDLGPGTWPPLRRHQRMASYDPDPLGLDPVAAEVL